MYHFAIAIALHLEVLLKVLSKNIWSCIHHRRNNSMLLPLWSVFISFSLEEYLSIQVPHIEERLEKLFCSVFFNYCSVECIKCWFWVGMNKCNFFLASILMPKVSVWVDIWQQSNTAVELLSCIVPHEQEAKCIKLDFNILSKLNTNFIKQNAKKNKN